MSVNEQITQNTSAEPEAWVKARQSLAQVRQSDPTATSNSSNLVNANVFWPPISSYGTHYGPNYVNFSYQYQMPPFGLVPQNYVNSLPNANSHSNWNRQPPAASNIRPTQPIIPKPNVSSSLYPNAVSLSSIPRPPTFQSQSVQNQSSTIQSVQNQSSIIQSVQNQSSAIQSVSNFAINDDASKKSSSNQKIKIQLAKDKLPNKLNNQLSNSQNEIDSKKDSEEKYNEKANHTPGKESTEQQQNWKNAFGPSLQQYVYKCFNQCSNDEEKDIVEKILKGKLTEAANKKILETKDWSKEPLVLLTNKDKLIFSYGNKIPEQRTNLTGKKFKSSRSSRSRSRSPSGSSWTSAGSRKSKIQRVFQSEPSDSDSSSGFIPLKKIKKKENNKNNKINNPIGNKKKQKKKKNKNNKNVNNKQNISQSAPEMTPQLMASRRARFEKQEPKRTAFVQNKFRIPKVERDAAIDDNFEISFSNAVVGTSTELEKRYLRLTSAPDPSTVRPPEILKNSLEMVKGKWIKNHDYRYTCDQLKSIRQDLTVQCVRDSFTVEVYEMHARIALEKGDHGEFNQCLSQLRVLFEIIKSDNSKEFIGYLILYLIFTENSSELQAVISKLSLDEIKDEVIKHALDVRCAWSLKNYYQMLKLYQSAPKMSGYLMDWFVQRERKQALRTIIKSYRPSVPVQFIQDVLAFDNRKSCIEFLAQFELSYADDSNTVIDSKASSNSISLKQNPTESSA